MIDFSTAGASGPTRPTLTASDPSVAQTMMRSGTSKGLRRSRTLGSTRRAPAQTARTSCHRDSIQLETERKVDRESNIARWGRRA